MSTDDSDQISLSRRRDASLKQSARQFIAARYGAPGTRSLATFAEKYLRAYHNEEHWDFTANGDLRTIEKFAESTANPQPVIADVGAFTGEWAKAILSCISEAKVHCFELIPANFDLLVSTMGSNPHVECHPFGLSSQSGTIPVVFDGTNPDTSGVAPVLDNRYVVESGRRTIQAAVRTGDEFMADAGLDSIDFLKIDVEGHEIDVLEGFSELLRGPSAPRIIQFEYGHTYLPSHRTLRDVYDILEPLDYAIGRIHPNLVDFCPYAPDLDHFRMGDYCAVKADDPLRYALERR